MDVIDSGIDIIGIIHRVPEVFSTERLREWGGLIVVVSYTEIILLYSIDSNAQTEMQTRSQLPKTVFFL